VVTWGEEAAQRPPAYTFSDVSAETRQLDASTFFAAGMAVFFLLFTVQFGVLGVLEEEENGTLSRLLAAPIGRRSVVAGKALLSFALGVISMTVLIAVTLGMLGGTFFPIGQGNDVLNRLTYITPHAWFMRGLSEISGGAEWTAALPSAGALLVIALVLGVAALIMLRRRLSL
jgi:ABC-2 type transport system permease protein